MESSVPFRKIVDTRDTTDALHDARKVAESLT